LCSRAGARSAGPLDGDLEVRSAFVVVDHGVLQLSAHIQYPINDRIRSALTGRGHTDLRSGGHAQPPSPPVVQRRRAEMTLKRELTYHAVSDRYLLRDAENVGQDQDVGQESFPTLEAALDKLGHVEDSADPGAVATAW
jgi:hypothetical protein